MANTAFAIKQDPFYQWLLANTALSASSVEKYARAVRTISREMLEQSVISTPLHSMSAFDIDIAVPAIMGNPIFADKNARGNHMYSNALKQYRMFLNFIDDHPDCRDYVATIERDTTIPETDRIAIVKSRIGQGLFRDKLFKKYAGHCVITGLDHPKLLIASHIKPWAASTNEERIQVDNGLLLSATYDRLFDSGLITFDGSGRIYISSLLGVENTARLHLTPQTVYPLLVSQQMKQHLEYHGDTDFVR